MNNLITELEGLFTNHGIKGVTCDSRQVQQDYAYFAISGNKFDGNDFIEDARDKGAKLIFTSNKGTKSALADSDDLILVDDARYALSIAASIIYPKLPGKLIAITGTNGKTSVASYCYLILAELGVKAASIGTLGIETNCLHDKPGEASKNKKTSQSKIVNAGGLTTSGPVEFRKQLHELAESGVEVVAFEASSHGIKQDRLGGIKADAAAFVSFSQDHLDYHGSMANYLAAKLKLFTDYLKPSAASILPIDINYKEEIISFFDEHNISYHYIDNRNSKVAISDSSGIDISSSDILGKPQAPSKLLSNVVSNDGENLDDKISVKIHSINSSINGQIIEFSYFNNKFLSSHNFDKDSIDDISETSEGYRLNIPMIGSFQASNMLLAIDLLASIGFDKKKIIKAASSITGVKGRLQRISKSSDDYHIFVDYAHTPDALEKSLIELVKLKKDKSRLIVVFGCGGNRDKGKRPIMGKIAAKLANVVIITDDNPRYEQASQIRKEIISGLNSDKEESNRHIQYDELHEVEGREEAIKLAINSMNKDDIVLIAGKGHEDYQIIKDDILQFSDISIAQKYMKKKL